MDTRDPCSAPEICTGDCTSCPTKPEEAEYPPVEKLEACEQAAYRHLRAVRGVLRAAALVEWARVYGISAGTKVRTKDGLYRVATLDRGYGPSWLDKPRARGCKLLKDGTWGTAKHSLYTAWKLAEDDRPGARGED